MKSIAAPISSPRKRLIFANSISGIFIYIKKKIEAPPPRRTRERTSLQPHPRAASRLTPPLREGSEWPELLNSPLFVLHFSLKRQWPELLNSSLFVLHFSLKRQWPGLLNSSLFVLHFSLKRQWPGLLNSSLFVLHFSLKRRQPFFTFNFGFGIFLISSRQSQAMAMEAMM